MSTVRRKVWVKTQQSGKEKKNFSLPFFLPFLVLKYLLPKRSHAHPVYTYIYIYIFALCWLLTCQSQPTSPWWVGARIDTGKADTTHPAWPYILVLYMEKEKEVLLSRAHSHHVQLPSCCSALRSSARIYFSCHITTSQKIS